ncbi:MAG: monovalent cation:proton antiporter-2 (CPA2) family protein [Hyphomicrobiales bacterium]
MNELSLWQIALLLAAAAVAAPVAKSLKIGSVLGYLVAGLLIGPHVLGVFDEPEKILHVAEFGVILLLFIIGLELRVQRLWAMRTAVFGLGGAQVALTAAVIAGGLLWIGQEWRIALLCGLALSLSSTAFVLQVLKERGELDNRHGRLAFAVLLFQDIAAIPMIALVGLLGTGGGEALGTAGALFAAAKALAAIALIIVASRFLLTRLYRLVAATGLQESMTASALLTIVVIVIVMHFVGLSAALGAFIAGVVLADSEYRHEIEANIQPFEGLLLGLFFVAVGMSIDTGVLFGEPGLVAMCVAALVAIKTLVLWPLGRRMRLDNANARRLGLALSQGGEFAFVLAAAALAERVITAETANLLNVVVAVSMAVTPLLLIIDDRLRGKAKVEAPKFDDMPKEEGHVVIAGLGRFGQIVARILRARKIPFTALDVSPEQVDFVRRFGSQIYYGDASRYEILEAAQTGKARAFVLAIDDPDASVRTAELVRRHYPNVPIYARARNRTHAHRLMDLGVTEFERETFLSSLDLTRRILRGLGFSEAESRRTVNTFAVMDVNRLVDDYKHFTDVEKMRANARRQAEELEQLFEEDVRALDQPKAAE